MSENGEIYTAGKNFTPPPAVTALTNSTSVILLMMMNLQVGQGSGPGGGGDGSGGGGRAWRPRALRHLLGVSGAL